MISYTFHIYYTIYSTIFIFHFCEIVTFFIKKAEFDTFRSIFYKVEVLWLQIHFISFYRHIQKIVPSIGSSCVFFFIKRF